MAWGPGPSQASELKRYTKCSSLCLDPPFIGPSSEFLGSQENSFMGDRAGSLFLLTTTKALGPPHLAVPFISDSLDLNLFPPHLLRGGSLVPERKGLLGDDQEPHAVLMNVWD